MKKQTIIALAVIGVLLVATIGVTFAYFASNSQNDDAGINAETEELGSILLEGTKVFTSYDLLPGQMGVQEFTIEKNSDTGNGIYEIDLEATVPEEFRSDIEILLYKTTDPVSNNVTVNVADPTLEDEMIYQSDSLNITGSPELVYQGVLTENPQIILEQADFDVTTLEKTTYYLVYHYKNNGNQDDQQGKTFTGTITVRLINEKLPTFEESILACDNTAANCIKDNASLSNEIATDDSDSNARYIGADPNNYVSFNNELWRIIGVFNNIDDGTGTKETRLKIIRDEPYSTGMAWDTDNVNDWTTASLQEELNTTYLNSIQSPYKEMIGNAVWNLGGLSSYDFLTSTSYTFERSTTVYNENPTEWTGQIGLIYPSDYGYATSGGSTGRDLCLSYNLVSWSGTDCYNNDWLYTFPAAWTITPSSTSSSSAYTITLSVYEISKYLYLQANVFPTLYLSSNVKITGGNGSRENPFTLSL